ncbi:ROK family transcriptional regulator [Saxibacter everestensis]|uniref:ROK family transcriptional regulator n=1 Tax=Saxibacter everestensis TaxID=2909229 RepID=A0ABY8QW71_9MICO|nr:ROK family transcriptional regulator [Brevibacteriaceae bacterium ZFBP1038]
MPKETAARRGTNLPRIADFNQAVILDAIRHSVDGLSRVELARLTGLSAQSISNITRRLLGRELISEGQRLEPSGRGKPRTLLQLHPTGHFAIGVHIDPTITTVVLLDLLGDVVASAESLPASTTSPENLVDAIASQVNELVTSQGVTASRVLGIGIAAPGPVDTKAGAVLHPPLLPGWERVELRRLLHEATGLPVVLHKDAAASALAELWRGPRGSAGVHEDFVFFYLGTGLGAGLVINGELLGGSSDNAGEIGHLMVDADGPVCSCGMRGCVGAACMPRTLVDEAASAGLITAPRNDNDPREIDELFTQLCDLASRAGPESARTAAHTSVRNLDPAVSREARARQMLELSAARLARGAATVANLLDVRAVIFGGPAWSRIANVFLPILQDTLLTTTEARQIHDVVALGSSIDDGVGAIGAGCLVLEHAFSTRPSTLLLGANS